MPRRPIRAPLLPMGGIRPVKQQAVNRAAIDRLNRKINRNIGVPYKGSLFMSVPSPSSEFYVPDFANMTDGDGMSTTANCYSYSVGAIRNIYVNPYVNKSQPGSISKDLEPYAFVSCDDKITTDSKGRKRTIHGPATRIAEDARFSQKLFGLPSPPVKMLFAPNIERPDKKNASLIAALSSPGTAGYSKSILFVDEPTPENNRGSMADYHFARLTVFANPYALLGIPEYSSVSAVQKAYVSVTSGFQSNDISKFSPSLLRFIREFGVDRAVGHLRQALSLGTQHAAQVAELYREKRRRFKNGRFGSWDTFDCLPLWTHKPGSSFVLKTDADGMLINDILAANLKFPGSDNNYRVPCIVFEVQLGKMAIGELIGTIPRSIVDASKK